MAVFANKHLTVIACAENWTIWQYRDTSVNSEELLQEGFFDSVSHLMACGDIMYLVAKDIVKQIYISKLNPVTLKEVNK